MSPCIVTVLFSNIAMCMMAYVQPLHAGEPSGTAITFTYSPPTETRYTETVHITRQRQATTGGVQTDELTSSSNILIQQTPVGWQVVVKPAEYGLKLNGRPVLDPFADLQSKVTITHHLDRQGMLVTTDVDYAALMNLLGRELPPQELAKVTPMIQQRAGELKEKAAAEWRARVGELIGKTVKIGDMWQQETSYVLPDGGGAVLTIKTQFEAMEPCGAGSCVRIRQTFSPVPQNGAVATGASGSLSRLVDPRTMLIYDETSESGMGMERESRVYEFNYGK
ncbi:MAG: hypothetical protein OEV28_01595 [Nitrospirota bacterium]|nr:hypothetical protein [Nitrospirota bacterium]